MKTQVKYDVSVVIRKKVDSHNDMTYEKFVISFTALSQAKDFVKGLIEWHVK